MSYASCVHELDLVVPGFGLKIRKWFDRDSELDRRAKLLRPLRPRARAEMRVCERAVSDAGRERLGEVGEEEETGGGSDEARMR